MAVKQLIERVELTSSASSITFSSIPQTFAHLVILFSLRTTQNQYYSISSLLFNFNTTNRSHVELEGDGSSVYSANATFFPTNTNGDGATASTFGNGQVYISNYSATDKGKALSGDVVTENNGTLARSQIYAGLWDVNDAVTSFKISTTNESYLAGSTISLYGITRGGDGTVTTA